MILATDNEAGNKIMGDLYTDAAKRIPKMHEEALAQEKSRSAREAFEMELEVGPYTYEAPWHPTEDR